MKSSTKNTDFSRLIPFTIELIDRRFKVSWIRLGNHMLDKPFFADSINQLQSLKKKPFTCVTDESALLQDCNKEDPVKPTAIIFHVSRCGSTLLSNCLQCLNDAVVIAEAQPLSALLVDYPAKFLPPAVKDWKKVQAAMLRNTVRHYGLKRGKKTRHLFIKFSSWNIKMIDTVKRLWPGTPLLFLYRNPEEVLSSLYTKHPQWIRLSLNPDMYRSVIQMSKSTIDKIQLGGFYVKMLKDFYRIGLEQANDLYLLRYEALNMNNILCFLLHIGIRAKPAEIKKMAEAMTYYSKGNSRPVAYQPADPGKKKDPEVIHLSEKHLARYFRLLNDRFAVQTIFATEESLPRP